MSDEDISRTTEGLELIDVSWLADHHVTKLQERQHMVDDLQFKPGEVILDLGCGPGLWSQMIAEYVQPNGRVVGVDLDPALTHYA